MPKVKDRYSWLVDEMLKNAEIYVTPKFPEFSWEKDGITYAATDIRWLRDAVSFTLNSIVREVAKNPEQKQITFLAEADIATVGQTKELGLLLTSIKARAAKNGKYGFIVDGVILCDGFIVHKKEYGTELVLYIKREDAKTVHENYQSILENDRIDFCRLVEVITAGWRNAFVDLNNAKN